MLNKSITTNMHREKLNRLKVKTNSKFKIYKTLNTNFKDFEFFNVVCGNVFKTFLTTGKKKFLEILKLFRNYTNSIEFLIIYILYKYESGTLTPDIYIDLINSNSFFKNILYFLTVLKTVSWSNFLKFANEVVKNSKVSNLNSILDSLVKIIKLKNTLDLYIKGLISEGHLKIALVTYKLNNNIKYIFSNMNLQKYINIDLNLTNLKKNFIDLTVGFYNIVIEKYNRFSLYTTTSRTLSIYSRKHYHTYLKSKLSKGNLTYAEKLAYKYLGKGLRLNYAKKWKNLRYRAYRIFLHTFNLKPFKLWQQTRKLRKFKHGGLLLDHLSFVELSFKTILLLSNFILNGIEFHEYLRKGLLCVNGRIISVSNFIVKPYQIIHYISDIVSYERNRFLLNLYSAFEKTIFNKSFNSVFEYNFVAHCFTMIPYLLDNKVVPHAPYYTTYNAGRFGVQKN
jgi:hypothetical protein